MIRLAALFALVASGSSDAPAWTFAAGSSFKYEIEFLRYYRIKGGAAELEGKDAYRDHVKTTAVFKVLEAKAGGGGVLEVRFAPFRAALGGDSGGGAVFDSGDRKNNQHPIEWTALVPELAFKVHVGASGAIEKTEGFDADRHLETMRFVLLGDRFLAAPVPPAAGQEGAGVIRCFHDLDSGGERFDLKDDTTAHDLPVTLRARGSKGGLEVSGTVKPDTKMDLGKPRREFFVPGVAFTGDWKGVWKDGSWTESAWTVKGAARTKIEGKAIEFELHSTYSARRVP